ncbi:MAG: hypothetical protein M1825_003631 [Sarcosagium campestre]|nr:MAG: hypothetical protein M1825_003631 [Sarcosagium campestre]
MKVKAVTRECRRGLARRLSHQSRPSSTFGIARTTKNYALGCSRRYASSSPTKETQEDAGKKLQPLIGEHVRRKIADRDLFLSILSSSSTKREAKSYLSRFRPFDGLKESGIGSLNKSNAGLNDAHSGVNLGRLYVPTTAVDQSPVFSQHPAPASISQTVIDTLHVALVKIRAPQVLDDNALEGIGLTLSQLRRLGLNSVIVVDCCVSREESHNEEEDAQGRKYLSNQVDRIVAGIELFGGNGACRVDNAISVSPRHHEAHSTNMVNGKTQVASRSLLLAPLKRGVIPVLAPVAYTADTQKAVAADADDVVVAISRELAGFRASVQPDEEMSSIADQIQMLQKQVSLDRFIILDPLGGIPMNNGLSKTHVFVNIEQEFDEIKAELSSKVEVSSPETGGASTLRLKLEPSEVHLKNLKLAREVLKILPPASSALLTTPREAADSGRRSPDPFDAADVGTRRQRNPLIHNLLTDKPTVSSSLPRGRLWHTSGNAPSQPAFTSTLNHATFFKRGMPLTILPDPKVQRWMPPKHGGSTLTLSDPRVDLSRLIDLIEDSFGRKLDVEHYLSRVNDRIAGIIIAGEYEGGALLTWEAPPGVEDDGSDSFRQRLVPYLDKFAVLKRSQGSGGVADIVFNAMVRNCLPSGVCWRSRRDNPVNKWYFERATGTWKVPESNWTMFWTTEDVTTAQSSVFWDYAGVCRSVEPSWADNKSIMD